MSATPTDVFGERPADNDITVPENQPFGLRFPEYVFRKLLMYGISQLRLHAQDPRDNPIDELFRMAGPDVCDIVKQYLFDHENIQCEVNWPAEDMSLPLIAIVNDGEREDSASALLGDDAGYMLGADTDTDTERASHREARAIPMLHTTSIYITTRQADLTLYLYAIVRFIITSNKLNLEKWYDVHNLSLSAQNLNLEERFAPELAYTRVLQLQYLTFFDYCLKEEVSRIVHFDLQVDNSTGVPVSVTLESDAQ